MDSQIPAYWGIVACVGGLGLLFGIKKFGPYYLHALEVASGVSIGNFARNTLGILMFVGAVGGGLTAVWFFVEGGSRLAAPNEHAEREIEEAKEEAKQVEDENLQVLAKEKEQQGLNWIFYGGGLVAGLIFAVWTGLVLINYDEVASIVRSSRLDKLA